MAIIGKIREKSILLVIIIGLALLAFILTDYQSMFGVNEGEYGVGHLFGEKIDQTKYSFLERKYGNDGAWDYYIDSAILNKEYNELGIQVSDKEFESYLKGDTTAGFTLKPIQPSPTRATLLNSIGQVYQQSQGQSFANIINLYQILSQPRQSDSLTVSLISQIKKNKKEWNLVKELYVDSRKKEKYLDIVSQGIYVTSVEAEDDFKGKEYKKSIRYVFKPNNSIDDSEIKYQESDLIKYYADHKFEGKYQNDNAYRVVKFFSISNAPSQADSSDFFGEFNTMQEEFANAEDDTVYSNSKSELKMAFFNARSTVVPENHFKAEELFNYPLDLDSAFKNANAGDIIGPYKCSDKMNGNLERNIYPQSVEVKGRKYYALSKVLGKTPTRIKARQILVTISEGEDTSAVEAKAKGYSNQLSNSRNRDETFENLKTNSADPVGEYDNLTEVFLNFPEQERTQFYGTEISDFCTNNPVGSVKLIETQLGFHIVEILERDAFDLAKVATIYREFKPSEQTKSMKEKEANTVLSTLFRKIKSLSDQDQIRAYFDSVILNGSYQPRAIQLFDNEPEAPANVVNEVVGNKLIQAAFKPGAKVGSLVGRPISDYDTYIVGMLYTTRKKGTPGYEEIKSDIEKDFRVAKKNEIITKNLSGKTLDELALSESVKPGEVAFNNMNNIDAKVIGSLFSANGAKDNQTTKPLSGTTGVYVITVDKVTAAPAKSSYKVEKTEMTKSLMKSLKGPMNPYSQNRKISEENYFIKGLYERANVIDNRKLLNLGIRN